MLWYDDDVVMVFEVFVCYNILSVFVVIVVDIFDMCLFEDNEFFEMFIGVFDVCDVVKVLFDIIKFVTTMLFVMMEIEKVERVVVDIYFIKVFGYDVDFMYMFNVVVILVYDLIVKGFFGGDADRSTIVYRVVLFEVDGVLCCLIL